MNKNTKYLFIIYFVIIAVLIFFFIGERGRNKEKEIENGESELKMQNVLEPEIESEPESEPGQVPETMESMDDYNMDFELIMPEELRKRLNYTDDILKKTIWDYYLQVGLIQSFRSAEVSSYDFTRWKNMVAIEVTLNNKSKTVLSIDYLDDNQAYEIKSWKDTE